MNKRELAPPTPEVQYLPAIFRRIDNGEIRIPAFQRNFVWTQSQIIELLESVYRGYPVGSVLFWKVESPILQIEENKSIPFPSVEEKYPISFVLDGMQRLSTLYGVFHKSLSDKNFGVSFDLASENFTYIENRDALDTEIKLSDLFVPRAFLESQRKLSSLDLGDEFIDRSIKLYSTFQEYLIPTVTIIGRDVNEVVEIFERINSTGTTLNSVDFMRALTWSSDFDLGKEISNLKNKMYAIGFQFPSETLVKIIALMIDKSPTPSEMLQLSKHSADELHHAVQKSEETLINCIDVLSSEFKIMSYDFVPYEGQLLVLAKIISITPTPNKDILDTVVRWFWSMSFSEGLRGRPDSYVISYINEAEKLANGDLNLLQRRLNLGQDDLIDRRFIKRKALSAGIASMLAVQGARSLTTGRIIEPELYMKEFSSENFLGLYSLKTLKDVFHPTFGSARIFSNIILVSEYDLESIFKSQSEPHEVIEYMYEKFGIQEANKILESQCISEKAAQCILDRDPLGFFKERANFLFRNALILTQK